MSGTEEWPLAEIISIKELEAQNYYYVHYVDCNISKLCEIARIIENSNHFS